MVQVEAVKNALGHDTGLKIQLGDAVVYWEYGLILKIGSNPNNASYTVNPFAFRRALEQTMQILSTNWTPTGKAAKIPKGKAQMWVLTKFSKLVNYLTYPHWQSMIAKMSGQDMLLAKSLFMADISKGGTGGMNILSGHFQCDALQLREIRNHKAAAMLAVNDHRKFAELSDWRHYYALNQQITPEFRETIDNFMSPIPFHILKRLCHVKVERALHKKVEIVSSIAAYHHQRPVVHNAPHKALKLALKKVGCDKLRSTFSILSSAADMTEYPDKATDIMDLADKRLSMQGGGIRMKAWNFLDNDNNPLAMDDSEIVFRAPIANPEVEGVTPITTMGDIWNIIDNNLVPGFTCREATALFRTDDVFPFMVEHEGFKTVAKVHSDGYIEAEEGTPADQYAKFYLKNWADDLSEEDLTV